MAKIRLTESELISLIEKTVESVLNEAEFDKQNIDRRNQKIIKLVGEINSLIEKAYDSEGDPIEVTDNSSTWESPMVYKPIMYGKDGKLKIINTYPMEPNRGEDVDIIRPNDMEYEGIPTLLNIKKMYVKALKHNTNNF